MLKLLAGLCAAWSLACSAAEITVLSAAAVQVPLEEVAAQFTKSTGLTVKLSFSTGGGVDAKIKAGEKFDVVINDQKRLTKPSQALGTVQIGVATRTGGVRPDVSSADAFKTSLQSVQSIAYGDPARGATTGIHFAKVLDQLGLVEVVRPKQLLAANGLEVMRLVASGEAEIGITQVSEILHIKGDSLVGPLPASLQLRTTYAASLGAEPATEVTRQFIDSLISQAGKERFRHAGFE
jgi:molybdate transport system substrate-binding protein